MLLDDSGEDFHAVAFGAGVSHNDDGAGDPQLSTISGEFGLSPLRDLAGEDEFAMFQIFLNMTGSSKIEADAVYQVIGGTADADVRDSEIFFQCFCDVRDGHGLFQNEFTDTILVFIHPCPAQSEMSYFPHSNQVFFCMVRVIVITVNRKTGIFQQIAFHIQDFAFESGGTFQRLNTVPVIVISGFVNDEEACAPLFCSAYHIRCGKHGYRDFSVERFFRIARLDRIASGIIMGLIAVGVVVQFLHEFADFHFLYLNFCMCV